MVSKQDLNKKQIDTIANAIIADMRESGLTPDQMQRILKLAQKKHKLLKQKKNELQ